ncbi:MAG: hypothetical protein MZW92_05775, partial [Comamonadaceae bacterium]|nr:hypothetical protein [Comamonadaceae bacterium]
SGKSPEKRFASLIKKMKGLLKELDVPLSLKKLGIAKGDFEAKMDEMVLFAMEDIDTSLQPPAHYKTREREDPAICL